MDSFKMPAMEINILQLVRQILKRWYVVVVAGFLAAVISFSYASFFVTPQYRANSAMLIDLRNSKFDQLEYEKVTIAQKYVLTFAYIVRSSFVLQPVIDELGLNETPSSLANKLTVSGINDTFIIRVSVDYPDKKTALEIIKAISKIAPEKIAEGITSGYITIIEQPTVSSGRVSPNKTRYTFMGALAGVFISVALLTVIFLINNKVKTVTELQQLVNLPVLGVIPSLDAPEKKKQGGANLG